MFPRFHHYNKRHLNHTFDNRPDMECMCSSLHPTPPQPRQSPAVSGLECKIQSCTDMCKHRELTVNHSVLFADKRLYPYHSYAYQRNGSILYVWYYATYCSYSHIYFSIKIYVYLCRLPNIGSKKSLH